MIPYCAILRVKSLIYPSAMASPPEYGLLNHQWLYVFNQYPRLGAILSIIFISVLGFYVNHLSNKSRIYNTKSLIPAVIFILTCSLFDDYLSLLPIHIALLFLLIALSNIFDTFKNNKCADSLFNIGFFIGCGCLFYLPFVVLYLFGFISIMIMKSFKWKDRLQYTIGFGVPFFLAFAVFYFWMDGGVLNDYVIHNISVSKVFSFNVTTIQWAGIIFFVVLMLLLLVQYNVYLTKKSMQARKNIDVLFWLCLVSLPAIFFWKHLGIDHFMFLAIPFAILFSVTLLKVRNKFFAELIHLMIILGVFYNQFFI